MTRKLFVSIICILLMTISCGKGHKQTPPPEEVEATKVERGTIVQRVLFTGNIDAEDAVELFPRAGGIVSKKMLKEGDAVKRGQTILVVDRDEVGYSFRSMPIESPIDGYVGKINVDVGSYVYERDLNINEPVAVVVKPGDMRVKLDIPERYLPVILPGTNVTMTVDSLGGAEFPGTIMTSSPVVDEKTRTARVEVLVPNPDGRLRHGMFGRMRLVVDKRNNTLIAPNEAISWEGAMRFVYKIEDGKARRAEVKTGLRNDSHVEILEGASEGDMLATGDLLNLKDGEAVKVLTNDERLTTNGE